MRTLKYIVSIIVLAGVFSACSDNWDNHYSQQDSIINSDNIEIVEIPIIEYLQSHSSYSSMNQLFDETGIFNRMTKENLLYTIFIVPDELITDLPQVENKDDKDKGDDEKDDAATFLAKAHITTVSLSPSNMRDNQRLVMWNGKYVNIAKMDAGSDHSEIITVNSSRVKRVVKTSNGFVYELESLINTPKSLLETIEDLSDKYSIFKEAILSKNEKTFDKSASVPNGVDASGNTTYDSVTVITNPYFLHHGVDITSESASFTMFIPSDELITNAVKDAKERLASWGMTRPDSILENWCWQVGFFNKIYTREEIQENIDLGELNKNNFYRWTTNIFGKQWRTTVNKVDLDNPIEMSNGIAYYMTSLKIPQNVLIWRIKDFMRNYKDFSAEDQEEYFRIENLKYETTKQESSSNPGGGWPIAYQITPYFHLLDKTVLDGWFHLKAFKSEVFDDNSYTIEPYTIPPGEYTFSIGFGRTSYQKHKADIFFNGKLVKQFTSASEPSSYNNDRVGGGYPEFYYLSTTTYDRDGKEVAVVTVEGDQPVPILIDYHAYEHDGASYTCLHHWCFRPTENCY